MFETTEIIACFNNMAMVRHPIQQYNRQFCIAKDATLLRECQVDRNYDVWQR